MARPRKRRKVCCLPKCKLFGPLKGDIGQDKIVTMTVDEYETIRLIDLEGMIQEECAKRMNVARTTVQRIYNEARKKIAQSLVNGKLLRIEGGDYKLCSGNRQKYGCGQCHKHRPRKGKNCEFETTYIEGENKEEIPMRIAIPVDSKSMDGRINSHFGRAGYFLIYNIEEDQANFIDNGAASSQGGAGVKASQIIVDEGVQALITPQCGVNAAEVFKAANIKLYKSEGNSIRDNIDLFKEGKLSLLDNIHPGYHK